MSANYGDVIYVQRTGYKHFGIYVGDNEVIHYTKVKGSCCDGIIQKTSIEEFLGNDKEYTICKFDKDLLDHLKDTFTDFVNPLSLINPTRLYRRMGKRIFSDITIYSPEETVKRAQSHIGEQGYNLLTNNCEHFSIWCKTGKKDSEQIDVLLDILPGGDVIRIFV